MTRYEQAISPVPMATTDHPRLRGPERRQGDRLPRASAFGAKVLERYDGPNGKVGHAEVLIGDSVVMLGDAMPTTRRCRPRSRTTSTNGDAVDATYKKALAAGATLGHRAEEPVLRLSQRERARRRRQPLDDLRGRRAARRQDEIIAPHEGHEVVSRRGGCGWPAGSRRARVPAVAGYRGKKAGAATRHATPPPLPARSSSAVPPAVAVRAGRRSAQGDPGARRRAEARRRGAGPARHHRLGQDVHDRERHRRRSSGRR